MNTANLQLEGLYAALASLMNTLRHKGLLTAEEIDACLTESERINTSRDLSPANIEAIRFPFRYLRAANRAAAGGNPRSFSDIATEIGMTKKTDERDVSSAG